MADEIYAMALWQRGGNRNIENNSADLQIAIGSAPKMLPRMWTLNAKIKHQGLKPNNAEFLMSQGNSIRGYYRAVKDVVRSFFGRSVCSKVLRFTMQIAYSADVWEAKQLAMKHRKATSHAKLQPRA